MLYQLCRHIVTSLDMTTSVFGHIYLHSLSPWNRYMCIYLLHAHVGVYERMIYSVPKLGNIMLSNNCVSAEYEFVVQILVLEFVWRFR